MCDALRDMVPFVQFKNVKNTHGGLLPLVKLQVPNGAKSRKASRIKMLQ